MAGVFFILIFGIAFLYPIVRLLRLQIPANVKRNLCVLALVLSPVVVLPIFFFLSKKISMEFGQFLMQLGVVSYFGPWIVYSHSKKTYGSKTSIASTTDNPQSNSDQRCPFCKKITPMDYSDCIWCHKTIATEGKSENAT